MGQHCSENLIHLRRSPGPKACNAGQHMASAPVPWLLWVLEQRHMITSNLIR